MYVGNFVFVEKVRDPSVDSKNHSTYYDGEYLILRETPYCLFGVKALTGWDFSDVRSLPIKGEAAFRILDSRTDHDEAAEVAARNLKWVEESTGPNGKKQYIESVYDKVRANAKALLRAIGVTLPSEVQIVVPQKAVVEIEIRVNGIPVKI